MSAPAPSWIRSNGFILGMFLSVVLAFALPQAGSRQGWLHPEILANVGIALILFIQGLTIPLERIRGGAGNWRLHALIQSFTFVIFPIVGLILQAILSVLWTGEPAAIRGGLLFLCVLPSTVSTSVVLTAVAGGNTAAAVISAALSNIMGVVLTPLLVSFLMHVSGGHGALGPLLLQITMLTLLPFAAGAAVRPFCREAVEAHKRWNSRICNAVILLMVYMAFCDSVTGRIWVTYGAGLTLKVLLIVVLLFVAISLLAYASSRLNRLGRADSIAVYFCSVKKTLAMGIPLAVLIFGRSANLGLILLPIMFYHPLQLLANGILANHLARTNPALK